MKNLLEEVKKASEEFKKRREGYKKAKKGIQINLSDLIGDNLTEEEIKERCETLIKWINKDRKDDDEYIDYIWSEFGNDEEWEKRMPPIYEKNKRIEPIEKAIKPKATVLTQLILLT